MRARRFGVQTFETFQTFAVLLSKNLNNSILMRFQCADILYICGGKGAPTHT